VGDLERVIVQRCSGAVVLCGHSMGCHTAAARALESAGDLAGVVLIGPANLGAPAPEEVLADWGRLADGLEQDGVDGFMRAYEEQLEVDPEWRETVLRFTRERMERHRHPEAVAAAVREVPRSAPFDGIGALESLDVPALVVASHDDGDPGHPYAVAQAWAESLPQARLISEERGEAPLAWRGGKLSRAIADFCAEPAVAERLSP
jgi:pimeloyl-ACP methyl ester carboxylesterase